MNEAGNEIWYCHVKEGDSTGLETGHWFFDTGQWAVCASASEDADGRWSVDLYFEVAGKPSPTGLPELKSIEAVQKFIAGYFGHAMKCVQPEDMPGADEL